MQETSWSIRHIKEKLHQSDIDEVVVLARAMLFDKAVLRQAVEVLCGRLSADAKIVLHEFNPRIWVPEQVVQKFLAVYDCQCVLEERLINAFGCAELTV
jgi:hypothetical protein